MEKEFEAFHSSLLNPKSSLLFRVLEVHTLHIRDFNGERIIQALGEFKNFEIETACAKSELQAILYPFKRILRKIFPYFILLVVGIIFSLTLAKKFDDIIVVKALGIIAAFCGVSGIFSETKKILTQRKNFLSMSPDEALKNSAWQCALKIAPKKFGDNDLTYIPVNDEVKNLSAEAIAEKYNLLEAISKKAFELLQVI
ncbi:MAG: hypothetical protein IJS40_09135 [Synergistaceae bacterium]|nr:hypothetical protein [Synergistaceae bacterium]